MSQSARPSDRDFSQPKFAEWIEFHVELPAFGPMVLRIEGGEAVKRFIGAELGL